MVVLGGVGGYHSLASRALGAGHGAHAAEHADVALQLQHLRKSTQTLDKVNSDPKCCPSDVTLQFQHRQIRENL